MESLTWLQTAHCYLPFSKKFMLRSGAMRGGICQVAWKRLRYRTMTSKSDPFFVEDRLKVQHSATVICLRKRQSQKILLSPDSLSSSLHQPPHQNADASNQPRKKVSPFLTLLFSNEEPFTCELIASISEGCNLSI